MVRRVVTGHDRLGKAIVIADDRAPLLHTSPGRPGFWSNDIWRTTATPAPICHAAQDPTLGPRRQLPDRMGSVIRINNFPPDDARLDPAAITREFAALGNVNASTHGASSPHPMMHRTQTIDYALVLSGEIYLVLDDSEVLLHAGDVAVQCGTNHAWSNRSNAPCKVAFILLDGRYDEELKLSLPRHP
jgi:hypothetical protein